MSITKVFHGKYSKMIKEIIAMQVRNAILNIIKRKQDIKIYLEHQMAGLLVGNSFFLMEDGTEV